MGWARELTCSLPTDLFEVDRTAGGVDRLTLRGSRVTVSIAPTAGAKVVSLVDNESGFDLLWHNPRVPLRPTYAGAPFDDVWSGGWDEVFPTDGPCEADGNTYHDHGDLWIAPWTWDLEASTGTSATVHLTAQSTSLPCRADKWLTLERGSDQIELRLRLTNLSALPFRFVWNQHVAHALVPGSRLHLPVSRLGVVGNAPSLGDASEVDWPCWNDRDLSLVAGAEAGTLELLYALDLSDGWCAVRHPTPALVLHLAYDNEVFATPWLWRAFGGWRGHHLLLTELCTSLPGDLRSSITNGSAATLQGEQSLETTVTVTVASQFDASARGDQDPLRRRSVRTPTSRRTVPAQPGEAAGP